MQPTVAIANPPNQPPLTIAATVPSAAEHQPAANSDNDCHKRRRGPPFGRLVSIPKCRVDTTKTDHEWQVSTPLEKSQKKPMQQAATVPLVICFCAIDGTFSNPFENVKSTLQKQITSGRNTEPETNLTHTV